MSSVATRPRGFAPYDPRQAALDVIVAVRTVLEDYRDFLPLTLRQIFYRLVVANVIGKTEPDYKRLGEILVRARRGGQIPFEAIRDDGFTRSAPPSYGSMADVLQTLREHINSLQIDRQARQERQLRVWCEAAGMVPQLARVAFPYGVPVLSSGGFDSVTVKHEVAREFANKAVTILHIGDFDPSGEHVCSSLDEDLIAFAREYSGDVELVRLAVTQEQVECYSLPTAPAKPTDRRSFSGSATAQCEALDPGTLARILNNAILEKLDVTAYESALGREAEIRAELRQRMGST